MSNTTTLSGNLTRDPRDPLHTRGPRQAPPSVSRSTGAGSHAARTNGRSRPSSSRSSVGGIWPRNVALSLVKGSRVIVTGRLDQRSWESDEGERRSRVEVSAEDVGASLRFATAEVTRAERRVPEEVTPGGSSDAPGAAERVGSGA